VIHTLLYGLAGAKVEGKSYGAQMPAWKGQLSNGDIAAVITYIRSSWGNKASAVTEADVAKVPK
jgi:mono/diheme cytochrome c family protein